MMRDNLKTAIYRQRSRAVYQRHESHSSHSSRQVAYDAIMQIMREHNLAERQKMSCDEKHLVTEIAPHTQDTALVDKLIS